jgi:hypothetical protein
MRFDAKTVVKTVALNIIFILITLYVVFFFFFDTRSAIETERAYFIEKQDEINANGYIFRNEEAIIPVSGKSVNYLIESGEKVGKDQSLAQANVNSYDLSLQGRIDEIEKKIDILDRSNINLKYVKTTLEKLENESNEIYLSIVQNLQSGKIKNAVKDRTELLITLNKKQLMTQEITKNTFDELISSLESEKIRLQTQTAQSGSGKNIYSERSGIFYSRVDGYENLFTAEAVKNLDFAKFNEYLTTTPDYNIIDNAIGKVAYDYDWYLVCVAPKKKNIDYVAGQTYNVVYPFSSNKTIKSVLTNKLESVNSDEVLLTFRTTLMPKGFDFSRKQAISLVFNEVSGIRVPEQAMRIVTDENGEPRQGVYTLRGNAVLFKELPEDECIGKYDGYYIYLEPSLRDEASRGTLQLNEDIITAGKDLYDGKTLD